MKIALFSLLLAIALCGNPNEKEIKTFSDCLQCLNAGRSTVHWHSNSSSYCCDSGERTANCDGKYQNVYNGPSKYAYCSAFSKCNYKLSVDKWSRQELNFENIPGD